MKITDVEAIYVRIPETQDGRAQDALLVKGMCCRNSELGCYA